MEPVNWADLNFWKSDKWIEIKGKLYTEKYLPTIDKVFRAFLRTPLQKTKVVIIGDDPYPHAGATGLAYSVPKDMKALPPSLENIFKELTSDLGVPKPLTGDLTPWAEQGVLLLNTSLTVEENFPGSHSDWGWDDLTNEVIDVVAFNKPKTVFILWGKAAQTNIPMISGKCKYICGAHPSPRTAHQGFYNSKPFSRCNDLLEQMGQTPIKWELPSTL